MGKNKELYPVRNLRFLTGFTLLELLIALTLFSVVMVVVGSVFGTGIFAWKRGEAETGFYQELRLTLDRMAIELRNAVPYEAVPFEGRKESLSFLALRSVRASSSAPEWVQVTYEVKKKEDATVLIRRIAPLLKKESQEDILLSSFSEIQFSYPVFEEEAWEWKEVWDPGESKGSPPFIKMTFWMEGGETWDKIFVIPTGTRGKEKEEEEENET